MAGSQEKCNREFGVVASKSHGFTLDAVSDLEFTIHCTSENKVCSISSFIRTPWVLVGSFINEEKILRTLRINHSHAPPF